MTGNVRIRTHTVNQPACSRIALSLLLTCAALTSCSRESAAHTVAWYLAHTADRRAMVGRCENDPGTLGKTPACVNAMAAAAQAGIGSLRDLPPMGLVEGEGKRRDSGSRLKGPGER